MEYVDVTPTWEEITPILIFVLENGAPEGQEFAKRELLRMAKLADLYIESQEKNRGLRSIH